MIKHNLYHLLDKGANIRCVTTIDNLECITDNSVFAIKPAEHLPRVNDTRE